MELLPVPAVPTMCKPDSDLEINAIEEAGSENRIHDYLSRENVDFVTTALD